MEQWVATEADETDRAILHSLLASEYAEYWQSNRRAIAARTNLVTDNQPADIREWTARQFVEQTDRHSQASTANVDLLLKTSTDAYVPFVEQGEQSAYTATTFTICWHEGPSAPCNPCLVQEQTH